MFNRIVADILPYMPKKFVWLVSQKYIAGTKLADAIKVSKELNSNGIKTTIDLLGEFIKDLNEAEKHKEEYLEIIDHCQKNNIDGNYSLKPSFFGLLIDKDICYQNIREVVVSAARSGNFVRIDMEDSSCTQLEINLFRKLKAEYPQNVGLVLQAYLKRTFTDIENMMDLHSSQNPLNIRICKGIYVEPEYIAYKSNYQINDNFLKILDFLFSNNIYPGIATHDDQLINGAYKLIEKYKVPVNKFEFQMLYGVTPELRKNIIKKGYPMRIYIPFGKDWFGYSTRRLKENPKIVSHIIKSFFIR